MAIENRNLEVGTRLVANYKKQAYVCTVEAADEGEGVVFALEDGKKFKSPSAAASAVMAGQSANGWRFWSLEGSADEPTIKVATKTKTRTKAGAKAKTASSRRNGRKNAHRIIRPTDYQEDVPEGQVRYWCDGCMEAFLGFAGEEPQQCPNGHRVDDPELTAAPIAEEAATE